ncbi:hypothetical protein KIW84_024393 [Lathyrus oleraceus]|uniref:Uncharacterized protein n=1 Tax=Pisum sativum TaxID=3888 RepID=A0A9D4YGS2_PEA|nr:hypothetical protein KIW84_024393 [Pisum sativum]
MATKNHVRSNSFPSQSHPNSARIEQDLSKIKTWETTSTSTSDSSTVGLSLLEDLYTSLEDFLNMASTQKVISQHQGENFVEELLDGSVKILDICGITRDIMLDIKENVEALHSSLRRRKGDSSIESSMESKFGASTLLNQDQEVVYVIRVLREVIVMNMSIFQSILSFLASKSKETKWSKMVKLMHKRTISCEEESLNELQCVDASLRTLLREGSDVAKMQVALESLKLWRMQLKG